MFREEGKVFRFGEVKKVSNNFVIEGMKSKRSAQSCWCVNRRGDLLQAPKHDLLFPTPFLQPLIIKNHFLTLHFFNFCFSMEIALWIDRDLWKMNSSSSSFFSPSHSSLRIKRLFFGLEFLKKRSIYEILKESLPYKKVLQVIITLPRRN